MYYDGSLTLTPEELVIMAQQRYMLMKTKGTFSKSLSPRKEIIELRAELNQVRALTKNITQAAIDKSPEEVLALTVRLLSRKQHTTNEARKQVPLATTTKLVATSSTKIGEITGNATSAIDTHTTLLGTAAIAHRAFIGIRNYKAYHTVVAATKPRKLTPNL